MICSACQSPNVIKARNDCGHFKADGVKPMRLYQWLCQSCGHVAIYAERKGDKPS